MCRSSKSRIRGLSGSFITVDPCADINVHALIAKSTSLGRQDKSDFSSLEYGRLFFLAMLCAYGMRFEGLPLPFM